MNTEQNLTKYGKYESENIVIKLGGEENNEKEYLLSVSKEDSYIEIYDFDNHIITQKESPTFIKIRLMKETFLAINAF